MSEKQATQLTTQAFGLALISAAVLIVTLVTLTLFGGEDIGFFILVLAVVAAVTYAVFKFDKTWARVLGLVATLGAGMMMFWLAFGLLQVFSPLEFIVGLTFVLGVVLSLVAGVRAISKGRKGGAIEGGTRLQKVTLGLIGVAAVISVVGFLVTRQSVSEAEAAGATPLAMANFEFEPFTSSIASGGKLVVSNTDAFAHDFTLDELGIYVYFSPGGEAVIDLSDVEPGTYQYYCSLHSDGTEGMVGTITIGS